MLRCTSPARTARTLAEALELRAAMPEATVLAGGTDLMVGLESGAPAPRAVLNLWGCAELRHLDGDAARGLSIGALSTFRDLRAHAGVPAALRDCAATVGAEQIQARATVGGNIVNASPAGDSLPLWLALNAAFELASVRGHRRVPADRFFLAYRRVDLRPDELLVAVHVPPWLGPEGEDRLVYRKVGTRAAQSISKVVLGGRVTLQGGVVRSASLAMGSVAPVPLRLRAVEEALVGRAPWPEAADEIARDIHPISDVRSTAAYRSSVARNVLRSWLGTLQA